MVCTDGPARRRFQPFGKRIERSGPPGSAAPVKADRGWYGGTGVGNCRRPDRVPLCLLLDLAVPAAAQPAGLGDGGIEDLETAAGCQVGQVQAHALFFCLVSAESHFTIGLGSKVEDDIGSIAGVFQ